MRQQILDYLTAVGLTEDAGYEAIRADIFDCFFASLPYFDLRAFQRPSGRSVAQLAAPAVEAG